MATTPLERLSPAARAKRIKELIKKPGTRAAVPTKYLPADMRRQRELNTRLTQPIVAGSAITNRDLAHQADAAVTEKYGLADTQANQDVRDRQQRETQVGGYYDRYLEELRAHATNTAAANQQAQQQIANLGNVTGPAGAQPQDQANQTDAANAAAVRQALLGSLQGALTAQTGASGTYADTLARVVGPGQKLQAQTAAAANTQKARDVLGTLAREKGSFKTTFKDQARADETKNVLSLQALGLDTAKAQANVTEKAAQLNKYGFTTSEWNQLSESERTKYRTGANKPKATPTTGYGAGRPGMNKYGYTYDEWSALKPAERDQARAGKDTTKPDDYAGAFEKKYGVKPATAPQVSNALSGIQSAGATLSQVVGSDPAYKKLTRAQASKQLGPLLLSGQKGVKDDPKTKDVDETSTEIKGSKGIWATVALDLAYLNGRISAGTATRLHRAGFSVKQLGLQTAARTGGADDPVQKQGRGDMQTSGKR